MSRQEKPVTPEPEEDESHSQVSKEGVVASTMSSPSAPDSEEVATLVFEVAGQRFGLPVEHVVQIFEMVAITPLPKAPEIVAGVINFHGRVIPVVDVRKRLNLPAKAYSLRTPIVVSRIRDQVAGLIVDSVSGVAELPSTEIAEPGEIFTPETRPALPLLHGVAQLETGLLLILDLATFLSREEEEALNQAMSKKRGAKSRTSRRK